MGRQVCVFVDGENFRHAICDLFSDFDPRDYLPKNARWDELFDRLVQKVDPSGERLRTYWYVVQSLDYFPVKLPKADVAPDGLRRILDKHEAFRKELETLTGAVLVAKMKDMSAELERRRERMRKRFDGWLYLQNQIAIRHRSVEFRRSGIPSYNLFTQKFGQEKAVDTKLSTDLIMLREIYDTAMIVSGDQDYVPPVEVIKDCGKRVVNVAFRTRSGDLLPGGARRLNQVTDWSLEFDYTELRTFLGLPPVAPPPATPAARPAPTPTSTPTAGPAPTPASPPPAKGKP